MLVAESQIADVDRNKETNLFDPKRIYKMGTSPLEQKIYARVLNKRNTVKGGLHHLTYIIKARCRMKKINISIIHGRGQERSMEDDVDHFSDQYATKSI